MSERISKEMLYRHWRQIEAYDRKNGYRVCFNQECKCELSFSHFLFEFIKIKVGINPEISSLHGFETLLEIVSNKEEIQVFYEEALKMWQNKVIKLYCCSCFAKVWKNSVILLKRGMKGVK